MDVIRAYQKKTLISPVGYMPPVFRLPIYIFHHNVGKQYVFTVPKNFGNGKVDSEVAL
jgi:hypothetical protein